MIREAVTQPVLLHRNLCFSFLLLQNEQPPQFFFHVHQKEVGYDLLELYWIKAKKIICRN